MDPYVWPGTTILRNRRGLHDAEALARYETRVVGRRAFALQRKPLPGRFDAEHLAAIHQYLFQDVYDWAGQFRTVEMSKPGQVWFARSMFIKPALDGLLKQLAAERHLAGMDAERFAARAGHYLGELNAIHPFREGNGRTQREFLRVLGLQAGHTLRWARITAAQMADASRLSFERGHASGLVEVVRTALELK